MNKKTLKKIANRKGLSLSQTHVNVIIGTGVIPVFSMTKTLQSLGYRFVPASEYVNKQTSFN